MAGTLESSGFLGEIGKEPEGPFGSNVKNLNVRIKNIWAILKRLETTGA